MSNLAELSQGTLMLYAGIGLMGLGIIALIIYAISVPRARRKMIQKIDREYE